MRKITFLSALLVLTNICFSWQVKLIKTISIDEDALFNAGFFVVLEDGNLLFTDIRDKNNQIKVFNEDGKLVKAWGKMGPGPDEFGGLGFLDYQSPYLAIADAGRHGIHVFEKLQNYEFKEIGNFLAWELTSHIKIYKKNVLMCGYIVSPRGEKYTLFMRDFSGKETEYLLPLENHHGARSMSEHKKIREKVSGLAALAFFDVYQDTVYYVSDVRLRVAKIDLKSKKIEFIGKEPKNFRALAMNKKTRNALLNPQTGKEFAENIITRHSFVNGIFTDKDFVGVIFVNREKKINNELFYVPHIQIYDHSGKFLHGQTLAPFFSEQRFTPLFYQKDEGHLYLGSLISSEDAVKYVVYKFSIEP
ncbi:6-bladed beta-propeller [Acidobacteriota bacterium]